jgi:hypothetical protein
MRALQNGLFWPKYGSRFIPFSGKVQFVVHPFPVLSPESRCLVVFYFDLPYRAFQSPKVTP